MTKDNYRARTISISDLLEAQTMYYNANDNLTDAKCNYQIKMARYLQALGVYKLIFFNDIKNSCFKI
jgi:hypothetical protein